jgi:chromosome segregation ATPase
MFGAANSGFSTSNASLGQSPSSNPSPTFTPKTPNNNIKSALPVIKENKLNETAYQGTSLAKSKANANYADIVCTSCQSHLMNVYHHCLADQDKVIPSPHHVDEIEDAKRKRPPPYFELLKDPVQPKNTMYVDLGEKTSIESRAKNISKKMDELQKGAIYSMHEKIHVMEKSMQSAEDKEKNGENFSGNLYKYTLQVKSHEIERLRVELLEKTESEKRELENVRKLRKALGKSMQYYIKAEEWQQDEASLLQNDIRTLKKEMSVIMACLIHAETEKKELRAIANEKDNIIAAKDAQLLENEKQLTEVRGKLHDSLKDYIRLNDKISSMAKQAESGNDQAEHRNNILQRNLETMSKDLFETNSELSKLKRKCGELESEMEFMVKQVNDLTRVKTDLIQENQTLSQELYAAQQQIEKHMDTEALDKNTIGALQKQYSALVESNKKDIAGLQKTITELAKAKEDMSALKKEDELTIEKVESENARLRATLKENVSKRENLEGQIKEINELRKREAQDRDRMIHELTEQVRLAHSDSKVHEEKRERALYQLNDLQSALDREMTQNRMLLVEIERLKRDYTELKVSSRAENEKLVEIKTTLTNDKLTLTKHVYEIRQELKDKKEEHTNLLLEYRGFQNEAREKYSALEKRYQDLCQEHADLNGKHLDLSNQYQGLQNVHDALTEEHEKILKRFAELDAIFKKTRSEYSHLTLYKDNLLKEKAELISKNTDLEASLEKSNKKVVEIQQLAEIKEREYTLTSQARESLINTLSNRANDLKEDLRKMGMSNTQYKDINQSLQIQLENTKRELTETIRLKTLLEEKLDDLRREVFVERKIRVDFERMHRRIDRKIENKEEEYLKTMAARDKKLANIDDVVNKENARLKEVIEIILPKMENATEETPNE